MTLQGVPKLGSLPLQKWVRGGDKGSRLLPRAAGVCEERERRGSAQSSKCACEGRGQGGAPALVGSAGRRGRAQLLGKSAVLCSRRWARLVMHLSRCFRSIVDTDPGDEGGARAGVRSAARERSRLCLAFSLERLHGWQEACPHVSKTCLRCWERPARPAGRHDGSVDL